MVVPRTVLLAIVKGGICPHYLIATDSEVCHQGQVKEDLPCFYEDSDAVSFGPDTCKFVQFYMSSNGALSYRGPYRQMRCTLQFSLPKLREEEGKSQAFHDCQPVARRRL